MVVRPIALTQIHWDTVKDLWGDPEKTPVMQATRRGIEITKSPFEAAKLLQFMMEGDVAEYLRVDLMARLSGTEMSSIIRLPVDLLIRYLDKCDSDPVEYIMLISGTLADYRTIQEVAMEPTQRDFIEQVRACVKPSNYWKFIS